MVGTIFMTPATTPRAKTPRGAAPFRSSGHFRPASSSASRLASLLSPRSRRKAFAAPVQEMILPDIADEWCDRCLDRAEIAMYAPPKSFKARARR